MANARIESIAFAPSVQHTPLLQALKVDCDDRGFPQTIPDLRRWLAAARIPPAHEAGECTGLADRSTEISKYDHTMTAAAYLTAHHAHPVASTLICWQGIFHEWVETHWRAMTPCELENRVYLWMGTCCQVTLTCRKFS